MYVYIFQHMTNLFLCWFIYMLYHFWRAELHFGMTGLTEHLNRMTLAAEIQIIYSLKGKLQ